MRINLDQSCPLGLGPLGGPARVARRSCSRLGEATRGSNRWIDIGPFSLQPSEFGKVILMVVLAGLAVERIGRAWARPASPCS